MRAEQVIAVYEETEQVAAAVAAEDYDAAEETLLEIRKTPGTLGATMRAWSGTLAANLNGHETLYLLGITDPQAPGAANLVRLIDTTAESDSAGRAVLADQIEHLSDSDLWDQWWNLAIAVSRWTTVLGGVTHFGRLLVEHDMAVVDNEKSDLAVPAAAVIALVSTGQDEFGRQQLARIIDHLQGLLQMWINLAARWLTGPVAMVELDAQAVPTALMDPHGNNAAGDDHVRVMQTLVAVVEASRGGDVEQLAVAVAAVEALSVEDKMVLAWQLAGTLGLHASRWLTPTSP